MFAIENFGVEPDLMTVAKSIAAGMPLSAVVGRKEIMDSVYPGGLGGTYGANPCPAPLPMRCWIFLKKKIFWKRHKPLVKSLAKPFAAWKRKFDHVGEIRGIGAMRGFTIVHADGTPDPDAAKKLSAYCFDNGLITLVCGIEGNVIRVLMPLVIEDDQLQKGWI